MDDLKPFGYPVDWIKDAELLEIPERARHLLEDYSGISSTELMSHINEVVSKAPRCAMALILTLEKRAKALKLVCGLLIYQPTNSHLLPVSLPVLGPLPISGRSNCSFLCLL